MDESRSKTRQHDRTRSRDRARRLSRGRSSDRSRRESRRRSRRSHDRSQHRSRSASRRSSRDRPDVEIRDWVRDGTDRNRAYTPSYRSRERDNVMQLTLNSILARLNTLESNNSVNTLNHRIHEENNVELSPNSNNLMTCDGIAQPSITPVPNVTVTEAQMFVESRATPNTLDHQSVNPRGDAVVSGTEVITNTARVLAEAIQSISVQKSQSYFVSSFDPKIHDVDVWCSEVERAKALNGWSDHECLSRVSKCLRATRGPG